MSRSLLLLRHGRTAYNAAGRIQGQLDVDLDEVGEAEVAVVAPLVAAFRPAIIVSSDLRRAWRTADAVGGLLGQQPVLDPRWREVDAGSWQGLTAAEAAERYPAEYAQWRRGEDVPRGGGETWAQVSERALPAVADTVAAVPSDGLALVVTHGGTARVVTAALMGIPVIQRWRVAGLGNCRWTLFAQRQEGWQLVMHGAGGVTSDDDVPAEMAGGAGSGVGGRNGLG